MISKRMSSLLVVAAMVLALAGPASATFPGKNGRIAFVQGPDIYTMNPDGSDVRQITFLGPDSVAFWQAWSPDGKQIVFSEFLAPDFIGQLWLMNADGSNQRLLLAESDYSDEQPSFSPDGNTILFARAQLDSEAQAVYRIRVDGTELTAITQLSPDIQDRGATYSPDGQTIAFQSQQRGGLLAAIYLMNLDGSHLRRMTPPEISAVRADWSPDGTKIAFRTHCCNPENEEIWLVSSNGTALRRLTQNEHGDQYFDFPHDFHPSWSPQGNAIVFERDAPDFSSSAIFVMKRDGSGLSQSLVVPGATRRHIEPRQTKGTSSSRHDRNRRLKEIEENGALPRWGPASN